MPPKRGQEVKQYEESMTLTQVNELLTQQKELFTALMQQQQDHYKGFVTMILDSTNSRLDSFSREIQELKASLNFTQKEIDDIKKHQINGIDHCKTMQTEIHKVCTVCWI